MHKKTLLVASAAAFMALSASPAQAGECRDPWITQAIREVTGREPNGSGETGECKYTQYGGGQWGPYSQLKGFVQKKLNPLPMPDLNTQFAPATQIKARVDQVKTRYMSDGRIQFFYNKKWYWLVGNDGASLIGNDSAGAVPTNAGNILSNANAALKARGY